MLDQTAQTVRAPQPGNQGSLLEQRDRATPNNLPLALSSFVGRTEAMARIRRLLASTRLLTLTGSGGVGKTRLALEVSTGLLDDFAEGVWWVDLAPLCEDGLVAYTIAMALGLPDDPARSTVATLSRHLRDRDLLLVLDNCEHLIGECAELAGQLLRRTPGLRMMATSREALGIDGETVWSVPPLSLPCLEEIPTRESLLQSEAGQLFLERAWAIQPDLLLSEAVARAIAEICCRLEGIPLAIELAAARVRALSVSQIAAHLDDLFRLLTEGSRTAPHRQRTLQATIEWSYDLLSEPEQRLFERLAVFVAGFSLEAAEAVSSDPAGPGAVSAGGILDLLSRLVLKSLVAMREGEPVRYGMLDSVRQYAWQRLLASGELQRIRERHLTHYLEVAERAESELTGAGQVTWLRLLESEHDNLRAALLWSQESGAGQAGLQLATALAAFWLRVGYLSEGSGWIERALAACEEAGPLRAKALYQAGRLAQAWGDYEQALTLASQSLALSHQLEHKQGMARALGLMGRITHAQGDRDRASPLLEEGLTLARESGDERTIARTLLFLGDLCLRQGAHEQAAALLHEALGLYQGMGDSWSMAWALGALGDLARLQGDHQRAVGHLQLSLALYQELDSKSEMPYTLEALAITAADQGQFRRAARFWGAASGLRDAVHAHLQPSYVADYGPTLEKVSAALGKDAFAIAWAEGQAMTLAEALALATEATSAAEPAEPEPPSPKLEPPSSAQPGAQAYGLTPREVEVLRLVACGLTDARIAEELVISPRTVGKHLESIYSKLYLPSRSAATRWAIEHGLG